MAENKKTSPQITKSDKLIKGPQVEKQTLIQSTSDFEKNFKPLFEKMEAWRKESASSQTRVD